MTALGQVLTPFPFMFACSTLSENTECLACAKKLTDSQLNLDSRFFGFLKLSIRKPTFSKFSHAMWLMSVK